MRLVYQSLIAVPLVAAVGAGGYWLNRTAGDPGDMAAGYEPGAVTVVTAEAQLEQVRDTFEATGTTRAREAVQVVTETAGRVTAIHFDEGERVEAGDVLLELDAQSQRAELAEVRARFKDASARYERARSLRETGAVPQQEVDTLEAGMQVAEAQVGLAETRLRDRTVRAPFDGVVGLREISAGAYVDPQTVITTLDDIDVLRVNFSVPERYLGFLRTGMEVSARTPGFAGEVFAGEVRRVDSRVNPVTRSVRVQSEIDNADRRLKPGMFLQVELDLEQREAVLVPEESVIVEGATTYLYTVVDDKARRVDVELGRRTRGFVEIAAGVEPGDAVVSMGHQHLRDGVAVRVRNGAEEVAAQRDTGRSDG